MLDFEQMALEIIRNISKASQPFLEQKCPIPLIEPLEEEDEEEKSHGGKA